MSKCWFWWCSWSTLVINISGCPSVYISPCFWFLEDVNFMNRKFPRARLTPSPSRSRFKWQMIKIWCLWNKICIRSRLTSMLHSIRQNNYVNIDKCIFPYKNSLLMNVMMWNQIYSKYVLQVHHICFYVLGWDKIWMKVCAISKMFCLEIFVVSLVWNLPLLEAERKPYELIYVIHVFVKIMFIVNSNLYVVDL